MTLVPTTQLGKLPSRLGNADRQTVAQVVRGQAANAHRATAHTKDRGEISGGGRKPWRQKGTGRARAGSTRSPVWRGGGTVFGPRSEENYRQRLPQALRRQALNLAVAHQHASQALLEVESWPTDGKTATLAKLLGPGGRTLILLGESDAMLRRASRNLEGTTVRSVSQVTPTEILAAKRIVSTPRDYQTLTQRLERPKVRVVAAAATTTTAAPKKVSRKVER